MCCDVATPWSKVFFAPSMPLKTIIRDQREGRLWTCEGYFHAFLLLVVVVFIFIRLDSILTENRGFMRQIDDEIQGFQQYQLGRGKFGDVAAIS